MFFVSLYRWKTCHISISGQFDLVHDLKQLSHLDGIGMPSQNALSTTKNKPKLKPEVKFQYDIFPL